MSSKSRVIYLALLAIVVLVPGAVGASQTQIYDHERHQWVPYDLSHARDYFNRYNQVPDLFSRQIVAFETSEEPGTIIIDTDRHFLYYIFSHFSAIRYGIGVGREGFGWAGILHVRRKAQWPKWTPPKEMIERDGRLAQYANGMPGGIDNPLGARALYLFDRHKDSLYRIHGTNEAWTIGLNLSSGCIRMDNDDIVDLYERTQLGAKVIVLMNKPALLKGM